MADLAVAAPSSHTLQQQQQQHASAFAGGAAKTDVRGHKAWARVYEQAHYQVEVNYKAQGKVAYGAAEVTAAVEWGAVEHLLVAGRASKALAAKVKAAGGSVFEVDHAHLPAEHAWLSTFTGLVALLRYAVPEDAAEQLQAAQAEKRVVKTSASASTKASKKAKKMPPPPPPAAEERHSLLTAVMVAAGAPAAAASTADEDEVEDEFEALAAIYPPMTPEEPVGTEFARVGATRTCVLAAHLVGTASAVCFRVVLPDQYPAAAAEVILEAHRAIGGGDAAAHLAVAAQAFCDAEAGEPVLFALAAHLEEALEDAADAAATAHAGTCASAA